MKYMVEVIRTSSAVFEVDADSEEDAKEVALDVVEIDDLEFCDLTCEAVIV